jgi:DNA methyltransferase 1-associated protein 1
MADIKDILGVPRATGTPGEKAEKPKKEKMKRPEGMSREAFALLGDSHPIISSQLLGGIKKNDVKAKPKPSTKGIPTWQYKPFKNSARSDGLELTRWVKSFKDLNGRVREPEDSDYYFAKFNKKVRPCHSRSMRLHAPMHACNSRSPHELTLLPSLATPMQPRQVQMYRYTQDEYDRLIAGDSGDWTKAETDYLMDLCDAFDLRFTVLHDRYEVRTQIMHTCRQAGRPRGRQRVRDGGPCLRLIRLCLS